MIRAWARRTFDAATRENLPVQSRLRSMPPRLLLAAAIHRPGPLLRQIDLRWRWYTRLPGDRFDWFTMDATVITVWPRSTRSINNHTGERVQGAGPHHLHAGMVLPTWPGIPRLLIRAMVPTVLLMAVIVWVL